jgi:hypothetical protein
VEGVNEFIKMSETDKKILDAALAAADSVLKQLAEENRWCGIADVDVEGRKHPIVFVEAGPPWPATTLRTFPFPVERLNDTSIEYYVFITQPNVYPFCYKTGEQIRALVPDSVRALGNHPTEQYAIELEFYVNEADQKWVN